MAESQGLGSSPARPPPVMPAEVLLAHGRLWSACCAGRLVSALLKPGAGMAVTDSYRTAIPLPGSVSLSVQWDELPAPTDKP